MTCIVGITHQGKVFIGGDSAAVSNSYVTIRADRKVIRNGPFIIGNSGSYRVLQLLQWSFSPPPHPVEMPDECFMNTLFVNAVRGCLQVGGVAEKVNEQERGGTLLVGYRGKLYGIYSDYQVEIPEDSYQAIGSGRPYALGALFNTPIIDPRRCIQTALQAAAYFDVYVRPPFVIEESD